MDEATLEQSVNMYMFLKMYVFCTCINASWLKASTRAILRASAFTEVSARVKES